MLVFFGVTTFFGSLQLHYDFIFLKARGKSGEAHFTLVPKNWPNSKVQMGFGPKAQKSLALDSFYIKNSWPKHRGMRWLPGLRDFGIELYN
jgi:hypothetical protein